MTFRLAVALLAGIALSACGHEEIKAATPPMDAAGKVTFTMDGFKPFEPADSPCPGAKGVSFSGEVSTFADLGTRLYATGVTRVSCGELGDHAFTYAFDGWRDG
jgi:hypothetical protein